MGRPRKIKLMAPPRQYVTPDEQEIFQVKGGFVIKKKEEQTMVFTKQSMYEVRVKKGNTWEPHFFNTDGEELIKKPS